MRIVYLARTRIPSDAANTISVVKMCEAFVRNGHDVILMNQDFPEGTRSVFEYYDVDPDFAVEAIPSRATDHGESAVDYQLRVQQFIRAQRPDLVFARHNTIVYGLHTLGLPIILECHWLITEHKDVDRFRALVARPSLRRVVTISSSLRLAYVDAFGLPKRLVRVAPSGADGANNISPAVLPRSRGLRVGYVGSLYPGKGVDIVVEAARRCAWASFHVVGGRVDDLARWKERASGLGNIHFHGFVPYRDIRQYHEAMDILLLPNQRQVSTAGSGELDIGRWTSPLKLFEYMAAGKPVVASDLPVLKEILVHDSNAYLCPPDDVARWVSALEHLRDHPGERARLGHAARAALRAQYTWQIRARRVLEGIRR